MNYKTLFLGLGILCGSSTAAEAEALKNGDLSTCGDPCFIQTNPGGSVDAFFKAAEEVQRGARKQIVISFQCSSACAIFADFARPKVCIMPSVEFGFHKATTFARRGQGWYPSEYSDPPHSADIRRWVYARGGFPGGYDRPEMLVMKYEEALKFFPPCRKDQLPRYMQ